MEDGVVGSRTLEDIRRIKKEITNIWKTRIGPICITVMGMGMKVRAMV